ncbi:MAG: hypothetical protein R3213_10480 [Flavobacteriaceae bacterium]|nr:hypothetical protein [Flavobacteriaceae bacterium]
MKKQAETPVAVMRTLEVKKDEIQKLLSNSLMQIKNLMGQNNLSLDQKNQQMDQLMTNLSKEIDTKVQEVQGPIRSIPAAPAQPGQTADDMPKGKRITKDQLIALVEDLKADEDDARDAPAWWQKLWAEIEDTFGGEYREVSEPNAVAGVRGSLRLAKKKPKKKKKEKHLSSRDSEHNNELPDFWRKNLDYGESPYMHLDEIEKITDKVPSKKKSK